MLPRGGELRILPRVPVRPAGTVAPRLAEETHLVRVVRAKTEAGAMARWRTEHELLREEQAESDDEEDPLEDPISQERRAIYRARVRGSVVPLPRRTRLETAPVTDITRKSYLHLLGRVAKLMGCAGLQWSADQPARDSRIGS